MLITEFTMMDPGPAGQSIFTRCYRSVAHFFGFGEPATGYWSTELPGSQWTPSQSEPMPRPELRIVPASDIGATPIVSLRWRRHEQLLRRPTSAIPDDERQARHQAVRGLHSARSGALKSAEHHFTQAAGCPDIDLSGIPGFWQLNRTAMMTAVHAYEKTGRLREAAALNARMRNRFRPRLLTPIPENITELPTRRISLSGNSLFVKSTSLG